MKLKDKRLKPLTQPSEVLKPTLFLLVSLNLTPCSDSKVKKTNTQEVIEVTDHSEVVVVAEEAAEVEVAEVHQEKDNKPEKVVKELQAEVADNNS